MINISESTLGSTIIADLNANFAELAINSGVHINSFVTLKDTMSGDILTEAINRNFRENCIDFSMSGLDLANELNKRFAINLRRFADNKIENVHQGVEPTALVSDDGSQMDVWFNFSYFYTRDGINFSTRQVIDMDGVNYMCGQVMKYNGIYYMTGVNLDAVNHPIALWSSTDKINFTYIGIILNNFGGSGDWEIESWGNTFLFYDNGKFHLLYEAYMALQDGYRIGLASADSIDGPYVDNPKNPILPFVAPDGIDFNEGQGNPELACLNNRVLKHNGNYYMYYHYNNTSVGHGIKRAYSPDLITWTDEGTILDNRTIPDNPLWSNGDQCLIEFQGRTYLFYTNNANGGGASMHIDVTVDDRSFKELLSIRP